jgi:ribosomal protein L13E
LYKRYLDLEKKDDRGIKRAKLHLSEVAEARMAMQSVRRRALHDAVPRKVTPRQARTGSGPTVQAKNARGLKSAQASKLGQSLYTKSAAATVHEENASILAWTLTGTGIVAMAAGTALFVSTMDDQKAIDNDLKTAGATEYETGRANVGTLNFGKKTYIGLSHADYKERQESVNTRVLGGHVLTWPGLALAGAGVWMLVSISDAPTTALVPYRDGARLQMAWRF